MSLFCTFSSNGDFASICILLLFCLGIRALQVLDTDQFPDRASSVLVKQSLQRVIFTVFEKYFTKCFFELILTVFCQKDAALANSMQLPLTRKISNRSKAEF